jgi:hypothetical protein
MLIGSITTTRQYSSVGDGAAVPLGGVKLVCVGVSETVLVRRIDANVELVDTSNRYTNACAAPVCVASATVKVGQPLVVAPLDGEIGTGALMTTDGAAGAVATGVGAAGGELDPQAAAAMAAAVHATAEQTNDATDCFMPSIVVASSAGLKEIFYNKFALWRIICN